MSFRNLCFVFALIVFYVNVSAAFEGQQKLVTGGEDQSKIRQNNNGKGVFYEQYIHNHLQIGTRSVHRVLTDDGSYPDEGWFDPDNLLGTIYGLEMKQNYMPLQFYARYFVNEYFGFELGYDQLKAKTLTPDRYGTDGDVSLRGITLGVMGFYHNASEFTPYAGLGLEFLSADFSEARHWATSWGGVRKREMVVDDVQAIFVAVGVMWALHDRWNVDFSAKYMGNADADVVFNGYTYGVLDTVQKGHYPLNNWCFQLGVSYNF